MAIDNAAIQENSDVLNKKGLTGSASGSIIYIYVNSTIYDGINSSLTQFKSDLEKTGRQIIIFNHSPSGLGMFSDADFIRSYCATQFAISPLEGVIFVGRLPYVMYDLGQIFPCDLYFMDLDGTWTDSDGNHIYEGHSDGAGDRDPEIWLGRIDASTLNGSDINQEINALNNYFLKNHMYRNGSLRRPHRELVYIDDTWSADAAEWAGQSIYAYQNQTIIATNAITTDTHYENILTNTSYEMVHLFVHSYYYEHVWTPSGTTTTAEIRSIDTKPLFYVLFACSAADFSQTNNIATEYLFSNNTLAVIGSSKTGGLYEPEWFFRPLGQNKSIGYSLMRWFSDATLPSAGLNNPSNSYGMTIFGDPTLTILRGDPSQGDGGGGIPGFDFSLSLLAALVLGIVIILEFRKDSINC
ncbi:MAG: C25 family cysteine peptidase [Candidatus Helarchaeota archaeon]